MSLRDAKDLSSLLDKVPFPPEFHPLSDTIEEIFGVRSDLLVTGEHQVRIIKVLASAASKGSRKDSFVPRGISALTVPPRGRLYLA